MNILEREYGSKNFFLSNLFTQRDVKRMPNWLFSCFANVSLKKYEHIHIPKLSESLTLRSVMKNILIKTHEELKIEIASMRKKKTLPAAAEKKSVKKVKKSLVFDSEYESLLLQKLNESEIKKDYVERHFVYNDIIKFYSYYKRLGEKYSKLCETFCKKDIASIYVMERQFVKKELSEIRNLKCAEYMELYLQRRSEIIKEGFYGNIKAFDELYSIYIERKDYCNAQKIINKAVEWGHNTVDFWKQENVRFQQKIDGLSFKENEKKF